MSIENYYVTSVSIKRLTVIAGTNKENYQTLYSPVMCRIEQQGELPVMMGDGSMYNLFKMWCSNSYDIKEGDQVISGTITYIVRGITDYSPHHLELLLALPK